MSFENLWSDLEDLGRSHHTGGYTRLTGSSADLTLREWFAGEATKRGMRLEVDRVGNQWAWLNEPGDPSDGSGGVVLGSHLDSVPEGGPFDGALGVISAFAAIDRLLEGDAAPQAPLGVVNFIEEEGGRFGTVCLGSRVLVGAVDAETALASRDSDGVALAEVLPRLGVDPGHFGPDPEALSRVGTYLELHIEQGRGLVDLDRPIGVASAIRPYGRWKVEFAGQANHAGTTRMSDRVDPMLGLAELIQVARRSGVRHGCMATVGKVQVNPNAANAIPSKATGWLDARGPDEEAVLRVAHDVAAIPDATVTQESFTPREPFDERLLALIGETLERPPVLESGAGHDAGILASVGIPAAMLLVRNPTGVSHSPDEEADFEDCRQGVSALATIAERLFHPA